MKITTTTQDTIDINDITEDHIVIIKHNGDWCILLRLDKYFQAFILNDKFTTGNRYTGILSLTEWITGSLTTEAHAFNTMKEACKELLVKVL